MVVSTNAGGLSEVIGENGIAGYSIDPDDIDNFTKAICDVKYPDRRKVGLQEKIELLNVQLKEWQKIMLVITLNKKYK